MPSMTKPDETQDAKIAIIALRQHRGQPRSMEAHISHDELAEMFGITPELVAQKCRRRQRPWPHHKHAKRGGMVPVFCEHDIEWIVHELQTEGEE